MSASILALDFDGVLCDGLAEYWHSASLAYGHLWGKADDLHPHELAFRQLRPVIEVGWEMPLLIRALVLGYDKNQCLHHWPRFVKQLCQQEQKSPATIANVLDEVRDRQIAENLSTWLQLHRFYPGIIPWLNQRVSQQIVYIITTKEGRFTQQLLRDAGVVLNPNHVWGKELKQSKPASLTQILQHHQIAPDRCHFLEDRLPTLHKVKETIPLRGMGLYLATWGYTTPEEISQAQGDRDIQTLTLGDLDRSIFGE